MKRFKQCTLTLTLSCRVERGEGRWKDLNNTPHPTLSRKWLCRKPIENKLI
jgi:hypothetical protein